MQFSLIIPSRQRTELLYNLLYSVKDISADTHNLEALIVIDSDDIGTQKIRQQYTQEFPFARFLSRERSQWLNRDYINYAAERSQGKYLALLNDDVVFTTRGWDAIAFAKCEEYLKPDGLLYGMTQDGSDELRDWQQLTYTSFPIISRKAAEVLNYAMPPWMRSWGADIYLYKLFNAVERVLNLREICFYHVSHHNQARERDRVNDHVQYLAELEGYNDDPKFDINRLKTYLSQVYLLPELRQQILAR